MPVEVSPRPSFEELGDSWSRAEVAVELQEVLRRRFPRPTKAQGWAVPLMLRGKDVMVCSQTLWLEIALKALKGFKKGFNEWYQKVDVRTGSGKTLAYLLPLLQLLLSSQRRSRAPGAVVLAPTRELAKQIATEAMALSKLPVACIFGGVPYRESGSDGDFDGDLGFIWR